MKKQYTWIGISLVVALVAIAYRYLPGGEPNSGMSAESELVVTATSETLANGHPVAAEQKRDTGSVRAPDERSLERTSETKGDRTRFSINYGEIGYVDVNSILRDRDSYSIIDLLQTHQELTGVDDSLDIVIEQISDNEIWGKKVFYRQVVNGQRIRESGSVFFQPDGSVTRMTGNLVSTRSIDVSNMLVLAPEAEATAREVASRYAANLEPGNPSWGNVPITLMARSAEMHYDLDENFKLIPFWRVYVGISGPVGTGIHVSVSPYTGDVIHVEDALDRQKTNGHAFVICDGAQAVTKDGKWPRESIEKSAEKCDLDNNEGSPTLISVNGECNVPSWMCQEAAFTGPQEAVDGVFAKVQGESPRTIASPIHILVRYPETGWSGDWNEETSTIRITATNKTPVSTAVHEAFHAVSRTTDDQIEHGLVYGLAAIHTGNSRDWHYEGVSVASEEHTFTPNGPAVANIVYRIYRKVGKEEAFKFVLDVDLKMPSTMDELHCCPNKVDLSLYKALL